MKPSLPHRQRSLSHPSGGGRNSVVSSRVLTTVNIANKSTPSVPFVVAAVPAASAAPRSGAVRLLRGPLDARAPPWPDDAQDYQWALMAESGVESIRTDFNWIAAQPVRNRPIDFGRFDALVRRAALRARIELLPVVNEAPRWARAYPLGLKSPPRNPADYARYLGALVERYGPNGTFWVENPTVPKRPVREWQIWNEPHLRLYWDARERSEYGGHPGTAACCVRPTRPSRPRTATPAWCSPASPSAPGS